MTSIVEALLDQARQYVQHNDARAEKSFALVLDNDAFNVEARTFLARLAMQAERPQQPFEHLHIATRVSPDNAALWGSLGLAHIALKQWAEAQTSLEKCLLLSPKMHAARLHLGKALERQDKHDEALKTYMESASDGNRTSLPDGSRHGHR